jgi:hypothetical protein
LLIEVVKVVGYLILDLYSMCTWKHIQNSLEGKAFGGVEL